jgi:hypothetical protein
MYRIWCEWDLGLNRDAVYASYEVAEKYATEGLEGMGEEFDNIESEGLIGIESVEVIYE